MTAIVEHSNVHPFQQTDLPERTETINPSLTKLINKLQELLLEFNLSELSVNGLSKQELDVKKKYTLLADNIRAKGYSLFALGIFMSAAGVGSAYFQTFDLFKNIAKPAFDSVSNITEASFGSKETELRGDISYIESRTQQKTNEGQLGDQMRNDAEQKLIRALDLITQILAQSAKSQS